MPAVSMAAPSTSQVLPDTLRFARVAFTGRLASMSRKEAEAVVRAGGGVPVSGVSRRTSMLVVGMDGWPLRPDATVSRKLQRAETLSRGGSRIRIVSGADFLELAGLEERRPDLRKSFPARRVCELLGLDEPTLRRWEVFGLVRSQHGLYDFQDLVSLRTIAELIAGGVDPATIGRSIRGLASVLPGTERPLAQLKLVADDPGTLAAELGELLVAPDGQLMINFSPAPGGEVEAIPARWFPEHDTAPAEEWFEHGQVCEDQERLEEAADSYREALSRQPHFPEAQYNLGNVLRELGRLDGAEERYRMAVAQDPAMAVAWYNLADLLEESDRMDEAVECLQRALHVSPDYADAHFNLASVFEQAERGQEAARHWAAYLEIDSSSEWARIAREHLSR